MFKEQKVAGMLVVFIVACAILAGLYLVFSVNSKASNISSFDECVAAGNPVMESYPDQCMANNRVFVNNTDPVGQ